MWNYNKSNVKSSKIVPQTQTYPLTFFTGFAEFVSVNMAAGRVVSQVYEESQRLILLSVPDEGCVMRWRKVRNLMIIRDGQKNPVILLAADAAADRIPSALVVLKHGVISASQRS